jgi:AcrR family transcriptional regulator
MPMSPRITEERKRETHERILATAENLFLTRGLNETSMNDIVEATGLSKGALYSHFNGKEELILAIHERKVEEAIEQFTGSIPEGLSSVEKLSRLADLALSLDAHPRTFQAANFEFMAAVSRNPAARPALNERYSRLTGFIKAIVEEGQASGEFREDADAGQVAAILFAAAEGLNYHWATTERSFDPVRVKAALLDLIIDGLGGRR